MDKKNFAELLDSVRWMKRHMAGKTKTGHVAAVNDMDVKRIRAATRLSQDKFAELISVNASTLRNWEQGRRRPTGPAQALLRAIAREPKAVMRALAA